MDAGRCRQQRFTELLGDILGPMGGWAQRFWGDRDDAHDMVQEACYRAYHSFDSFRHGTNFKAWMFTILRNVCINAHRRRKLGPQMVPIDRLLPVVAADEPHEAGFWDGKGIDNLGCQAAFSDEVYAALFSIPAHYRAVVILVDAGGLSYREVAALLGCPVGTVMSRLFRGRRLLRPLLEEYAQRQRCVVTRRRAEPQDLALAA